MLVILSGVSGVGKNTIIQKLLDKHDNVHFFKSATTRPPRPGETIYDFMSAEEFKEKSEAGAFFEIEDSHGFWYATQFKELNRIESNPNEIFIKDIEVHGAEKLKEYFKGKIDVVMFFIDAPDDVLVERLRGRGESEDRIQVRLSRGVMERLYKDSYDMVIENYDLEDTVSKIENYIFPRLNKK